MLKIPERSSTTVTLYEGADFEKFEALNAAVLAAAEKSGEKRLGDDSSVLEASEALDAFTVEAAGRGQVVKVQAPSKRRLREIALGHLPRVDNETDAQQGFNVDTYPDEFLPACLPLEGQFEDVGARAEFVDNLSEGNFLKLLRAAYRVSREQGVGDPKAPSLSSTLERTSDESSQPPARLG